MHRLIRKKFNIGKALAIIILLFFIPQIQVYASDLIDDNLENETSSNQDSHFRQIQNNEMEYDEIQYVIDDLLTENNKFNFASFVSDLVSGKKNLSFVEILKAIKDGIVGEFKGNINRLTLIMSIAIIAAVFTSISQAFKDNQVADAGFYITYLLLFSVLTSSYIAVSNLAASTIGSLLDFMKVLVPTYIMALVFSTGTTTSYVYSHSSLFLITFIDVIILKIIIPLINIHFILTLANNLSKEDMLSKLAQLISDLVKWSLKALVALVVGINTASGLISPISDNLKKSAIFKTAKAIPGVGDIIGGVAESMVSVSILLKNAIGVAGVVVILVICALPVCKLAVTTIVYKLSSALVQPISDKRLLNCISGAGDSSSLLLNTVIVGLILFIITITIIAVTTS